MTMRLQYVGGLDKTLVDVASLTFGREIEVDDELGGKLLLQFADEFVVVPAPEEPAPARASKFEKTVAPGSVTSDVADGEVVDKGVVSA